MAFLEIVGFVVLWLATVAICFGCIAAADTDRSLIDVWLGRWPNE